jgi:hypothetical protein
MYLVIGFQTQRSSTQCKTTVLINVKNKCTRIQATTGSFTTTANKRYTVRTKRDAKTAQFVAGAKK